MTKKNRKTIIKEMIINEIGTMPGFVLWVGKENGSYQIIDKKLMNQVQINIAEMELEDLSSYVREYLKETKTVEADIWK
jgi:hypothetical protein